MSSDWDRRVAIVVATFEHDGIHTFKVSTACAVATISTGGTRLVTTLHGLVDPHALRTKIEVAFEYRREDVQVATIAWEAADTDLAVLETTAVGSPAPIVSAPHKLSEDSAAVGYARAGKLGDRRPPVAMSGKLYAYDRKTKLLHVGIDHAATRPDGWMGASGAPVFVGGNLVGLIKDVPADFGGERLDVIDLARVIRATPGLRHLVPISDWRKPAAIASAVALVVVGTAVVVARPWAAHTQVDASVDATEVPPPSGLTGDVIVIHDFVPTDNTREDITGKIVRSLSELDAADDTVVIYKIDRPYDAKLAESWARQGFIPFLSIGGDYTQREARGRLVASVTEATISVIDPKVLDESAAMYDLVPMLDLSERSPTSSLLRFNVPHSTEEDISLIFERDVQAKTLLREFPHEVSAYLAIVIATRHLAAGRHEIARRWLNASEQLAPLDKDGKQLDGALRNVLAAVTELRAREIEAAIRRIVLAIEAPETTVADSSAVLVRDRIRATLPKMIYAEVLQVMPHVQTRIMRARAELRHEYESAKRRMPRDDLERRFSGMRGVDAILERAAIPQAGTLLRFYIDHLPDHMALLDEAGQRAEERVAKQLETVKDRSEAEPQNRKLALEAELLKEQLRWLMGHDLEHLARIVHAKQELLEHEIDAISDDDKRRHDLERMLGVTHDLRTMFHQMDAVVEETRAAIEDYARSKRLRCGPTFVVSGNVLDDKTLIVTLPEDRVVKLARAIESCRHCLPYEVRELISGLPHLLGCSRAAVR